MARARAAPWPAMVARNGTGMNTATNTTTINQNSSLPARRQRPVVDRRVVAAADSRRMSATSSDQTSQGSAAPTATIDAASGSQSAARLVA